jgi:ABC-type uncharacterized transport system involved in gliding motility auxiliary subunit
MKANQIKRFAPIGLYVAILAALVSGGLYIVQRSFNLPLQISLALIVVGLAAYALMDPHHLRELLTGRQARYSSNAVVLTIAFIGIVIVINYLAYKNPVRWDLTEDKQHTLSKETLETLNSLKEPVKVEAYFSSRMSNQTAQDLLDSFQYNSNGNLSYEFVDPEEDPVRAQSAQVTRDGTIVLTQADRSEQITFTEEQELTSALIRLSNPGTRAVYFLIGHGEYNPDDAGDQSFSQAKAALSAKNYTVATLNLLATRTIPGDALALIVAGADKPISQEEIDLIKAYLEAGGSLVYLAEPPLVTQFGDSPDPFLPYLADNWGIELGNDMVIDLNYDPPSVAVSATYNDHPITAKMGNLAVVMPSSRSMTVVSSENTALSSTILVLTASNSWAEKDNESLRSNTVSFDESTDTPGPVTLAVAVENMTTGGRAVIIGDSDFASTSNFAQYGNGDFLINSIDWAAGQENLISLTPKASTQRVLIMRSQSTLGLILLSSIFLLPGAVIIGGIIVWIRRKRRG